MSNATDFLASLPGRLADLTAIHPSNGKITGRSFNVKGNAEDRVACEEWIENATAKGYGLYFNINSLRAPLGPNFRKAKTADVTVLNAFHVDADVPKDTAPDAFAAAKSELLRSIQGMNRPPTIIIDSGNGYGLFWVLRKPVKVTAANLDQLTGINIALRDAVPGAADACQNLDRVMRLPFTINYPNAAKIARGRVKVETDLISDLRDPLLGEVLYSVEDFEAVAPVAAAPPLAPSAVEAIDIPDSVDMGRLDPDLRKLIEKGPAEGRKIGDGTRNAYSFMVACALVQLGFSEGEIVWILTNPDFKASEHVLDQKSRTAEVYARRMIRMARERGARSAADEFGVDPLDKLDEKEQRASERAEAANAARGNAPLGIKDFLFYLPDKGGYLCIPQGADVLFPAKSVNLMVPPRDDGPIIHPKKSEAMTPEERKAIDGFEDIYQHLPDGEIEHEWTPAANVIASNKTQNVLGMTWWPGKPSVIRDSIFMFKGGIVPKQGAHTFNRYVPPFLTVTAVDKQPPDLWLDHIKLIYPDDWQHIVHWLAQRVQFPHIKIHHALVLGGGTRIGKDLLLHPVTKTVGPWNFESTTALAIMDKPENNSYLEAVICLVHEVEDFGDDNRFGFYSRMKPWLGGTAVDVLKVADKYIRVHPVVDVVGFIIGTNHKIRGLFLPPDDTRHYVAWSYRTWDDWGYSFDELTKKYHGPLYTWFDEEGGNERVAHYLRTLDLSKFNPKAPPPRTAAWHEIVNARKNPDANALERILESMDNPEAVTVAEVTRADAVAAGSSLNWLSDRAAIPADFEDCGYVQQMNAGGGKWQYGPKTARRPVSIYVKAKLSAKDKMEAAREAFEREKRYATTQPA